MKPIGRSALWIYLGSGPIYWVPAVAPIVLLTLKTILFSIIFLAALFPALTRKKLLFPGGGATLMVLLCVLGLTLPGALAGTPDAGAYRLFNVVQIIVFLFACRQLLDEESWRPVIQKAVLLFSGIATVCLMGMVLMPNIPNPFHGALTLSDTGFGGARTGWSPAMALYAAWFVGSYPVIAGAWLSVFAFAVLLGNQVIVGGRSGILAVIVTVVARQLMKRSAWSYVSAVSFAIAAVAVLLAFPELFRIEISGSGALNFASLDKISSGRLAQYSIALSQITDAPWFGAGFGNVSYGDEGRSLHNEFFRLAIEGGIPLAVISALPLFLAGRRLLLAGENVFRAIPLTLLVGVVVAQLEPNFIYGNFNTSALWWFSFSLAFLPRDDQKTN